MPRFLGLCSIIKSYKHINTVLYKPPLNTRKSSPLNLTSFIMQDRGNHNESLVKIKHFWNWANFSRTVVSHLMRLWGLCHKASTMEMDQETWRRGEALGLQPQGKRDSTPLGAGQRQQCFTVLKEWDYIYNKKKKNKKNIIRRTNNLEDEQKDK